MQTCFFNMADDPCLFTDVSTMSSLENRVCALPQHDGRCQVPKVDMVMAGTSCTGGSKLNMKWAELRTAMAEKRKGVQTVATFLGFVEALELSQAKCAILENVMSMGDVEAANLGSAIEKDNLSEFVRVLSEAGWVCQIAILESSDYYLPQRRQRIYMFAFQESWLMECGVEAQDAFDLILDMLGHLAAPGKANPVSAFLEKPESCYIGEELERLQEIHAQQRASPFHQVGG